MSPNLWVEIWGPPINGVKFGVSPVHGVRCELFGVFEIWGVPPVYGAEIWGVWGSFGVSPPSLCDEIWGIPRSYGVKFGVSPLNGLRHCGGDGVGDTGGVTRTG